MNASAHATPLLRVEDLRVWFPIKQPLAWLTRRPPMRVRAVDGVSFELEQGEVLGVVGESGCGKSTLARAVARLEQPTSGAIYLEGEDIAMLRPAALRRRRAALQMVFQDPYASLNPRMTVFDAIAEAVRTRGRVSANDCAEEVLALMEQVGLARRSVRKYPHEFSGGQRQRIAIARALAPHPKLLIADEPVSALDVSVQAQIINLLVDLQQQHGLAMMFISHDLGVVRHAAQRIAVMYLGRVVEWGPAQALFDHPRHSYAQALIASIPIPDPLREQHRIKPIPKGEPPSPMQPPSGCPFHPRCPRAVARCAAEEPLLLACGPERKVACLLEHDACSVA